MGPVPTRSVADAYLPKYRHVGQTLAGEIRDGRLRPGQRLPSDDELMGRFSISRGTLLRALEFLKNDGVLERVPGRGSFVREPSTAPPPAVSSGLRVMFVAEGGAATADTIFGPIEHHVAVRLRRRHGIELVPRQAGLPLDPFEVRRQLIADAVAVGVDGLLYLPLEGERQQWQRNAELLKPAVAAGLQIVLLDRDVVPRPDRSGYDVVGTDDRIAGGAVGRHLIQRGCRNLLFVRPRGDSPTVDERVDGVRDAIRDASQAGGEVRLSVAAAASVDPPAPRDDGIREALSRVKPDGVIAKDDRTAVAVLRVLYERHTRVPDQVRVAGFDDAEVAADTTVPLTTYRQPIEEIAEVAAERISRRLAGERIPAAKILIGGRLVERQSTAPTRD